LAERQCLILAALGKAVLYVTVVLSLEQMPRALGKAWLHAGEVAACFAALELCSSGKLTGR